MHPQLDRQRNRSSEPEQRKEGVDGERHDAAERDRVHEGGGDEVDEGEHGEDGADHGEVDDGGVFEGVGDHMACERHDDKRAEELRQLC